MDWNKHIISWSNVKFYALPLVVAYKHWNTKCLSELEKQKTRTNTNTITLVLCLLTQTIPMLYITAISLESTQSLILIVIWFENLKRSLQISKLCCAIIFSIFTWLDEHNKNIYLPTEGITSLTFSIYCFKLIVTNGRYIIKINLSSK